MRDLTSEPLLTDTGLGVTPGNTSARLLRHGLSVTAFASLEKYLQFLFEDFASSIASMTINYGALPETFRKFMTMDAIVGFQNKVGLMAKHDRLSHFESKLPTLAKYSETPAQFSGYGFSPKGSNVGAEDIKSGLKALGVADPWRKLTAITAEIGFSRPSLEADFRNLAKSRHTSAHNPTGNIPTQDLATNIDVASLVAVSISALLEALKPIYLGVSTASQLTSQTESPALKFRYIDELSNGEWMERGGPTGRGVKKYASLELAKVGALGRAGRFSVLVRAQNLTPLEIY